MITNNEEIFNQRAYPLIEYMLSRGKFLFTTDRTQKIQSPSYTRITFGPSRPTTTVNAWVADSGDPKPELTLS